MPQGVASVELAHDPDRLRSPVRRQQDGTFVPISWDEAFDLVEKRIREIRSAHGDDAVGVYMGTPLYRKDAALLLRSGLLGALGTHNSTSPGSQDTSPRFVTSLWLYGASLSVPVPDVDRTSYFLCIGANPLASNGSFLTAPDMGGRLKTIRARGGRVVVVDPRRTETASLADEHVPIIPGTDAALLLGMVAYLSNHKRTDDRWMDAHCEGWDTLRRHLSEFTPDRVADACGLPRGTVERLANEFVGASSPVAYSRVGVCNSAHGTLATFATDLLNIATGRLGAVGGAMFPSPAVDVAGLARQLKTDGFGRWKSRVRGLPETMGDLPASVLAEEMETPGKGQIRAFVTVAGNPVLSSPNGRRLDAALAKLEFMVSVDHYVNETTRHADVIFPPACTMSDAHTDVLFANFAARNFVRWMPAVVPLLPSERAEWQILFELTHRFGGGPTGNRFGDLFFRGAAALGHGWTPELIFSLAIRFGPHGRGLFGRKGLTGEIVRGAANGIDLGPLVPGHRRRVYHRGGRIRLDVPQLLAAIDAFAPKLGALESDELLMIGRRDLRSNNTWMHNLPMLVRGKDRCVLFIHPADAARAGLQSGVEAVLENRIHRDRVRVRVTDEVREGVVSLPHGWGHSGIVAWQRVAGKTSGVSANDWADDQYVESLVGQSILNGIPVRVSRVDTNDSR